jgi:hypothetical protein
MLGLSGRRYALLARAKLPAVERKSAVTKDVSAVYIPSSCAVEKMIATEGKLATKKSYRL